MDWATVAKLIIEVGLPATQQIIANWSNKSPVTPEEFANVRATASQTATDRLKERLVKAGIPLDSEQAKALLALTD